MLAICIGDGTETDASMKSLAIALAALLLIPAGAAAKSGIELLGPTPDGFAAGQPWTVGIVGIRSDRRVDPRGSATPGVAIKKESGDGKYWFAARRQPNGTYTARIVFPSSGSWTYRVSGFGALGAHQYWDPVRIAQSARESAPGDRTSASSPAGDAASGEGDLPLGWIVGASPMIVALGLLIHRRRGSPGQA
jgi:hypothetical protein